MGAREGLNKLFPLVPFDVAQESVRQAHLERNQPRAVRPELVEGPIQGFASNRAPRERPQRNSRAPRAGAFSILAALAFPAPANAVDWLFDANLGASATYTDNVGQSSTNPEDALILRVSPGFTLRTEGSRRLNATIQYSLTGVARFGGRDDTDIFHALNARGTAELVEDFFFVDASARVSQELISLSGSPADATINPDNRATAASHSRTPRMSRVRWAGMASSSMRLWAAPKKSLP
jgi:hypothetical protein